MPVQCVRGRDERASGMYGDKSGESGAFFIAQRVPDFCDGRRSFPTNENSNLYRRGRRRPPARTAMDFAHYQSPKLLGTSLPIINKRSVSRKYGTDLWRISDISAKSGMVGKK